MPRLHIILAVLVITALGAGCKARQLSEMEVIGACIGAETGEISCSINKELCESIRQVLRTEHESQQACVDACRAADRVDRRFPAVFGCPGTVTTGQRMCVRYCKGKYPEG